MAIGHLRVHRCADWGPGAVTPAGSGLRRVRREDAYADLAGASSLLLHVSVDAQTGSGRSASDEAWVRFGAARARVLLHESDLRCRNAIGQPAARFDDLYSTRVSLDSSQPTKEEMVRRSQEHISKMKTAEAALAFVLSTARAILSDALIE